MNKITMHNFSVQQTLFDSATSMFNDYYKINSEKVSIMCMVQDLLLTVQNILSGIALVSQSPVDEYSSNWEIKTSENKPIVVLQYSTLSNFLDKDTAKKEEEKLTQEFIRNDSTYKEEAPSLQNWDPISKSGENDDKEISEINSVSDVICPLDYVSVCITENANDVTSNKFNCNEIKIKQEVPEMLRVYDSATNVRHEENVIENELIQIRSVDSELNYENVPSHESGLVYVEEKKNHCNDCLIFKTIESDKNISIDVSKTDADDYCTKSSKLLSKDYPSPPIHSEKIVKSYCKNGKNIKAIESFSKIDQKTVAKSENCSDKSHTINLNNSRSKVNICQNAQEVISHIRNMSTHKLPDFVHPDERININFPFTDSVILFPLDSHNCSVSTRSEKENSQHVTKSKSDEKRFFCRFCNKAFKRLNDKKIHERIHTGEKPYSCTYCHKKFSLLHNRKTHELIHTGEKPYACRYCKKTFTYLRSKKYHELCHEGRKPYSRNQQNNLKDMHSIQ